MKKHSVRISTALMLMLLAGVCTLNSTYFTKLFKSTLGITPLQYINRSRVEKSKYLLEHTQFSVGEISDEVGFEDELYFSRVFKKFTGIPPQSFSQAISSSNTPEWFFEN